MTKDETTKAVIQIFGDRGLTAKTTDLLAAIVEITNLIDEAVINAIIEHDKSVGSVEAAFAADRKANPGKYSADEVTEMIPKYVEGARLGNFDEELPPRGNRK